jgi:outer membrane immunogenic protein
MNRIIIACALALTAGTPALAADLPPVAPRAPAAYAPAVAPIYNWSGIYLGVNGGYGFGTTKWNLTVPPFPAASGSIGTSGGLVGGTIGANYQIGQFVIGVEGDGDWVDITSSGITGCNGCLGTDNWLATIRGRAGFAWDRVLLFGTGGAAFSDGVTTNSDTQTGWTAGGGVEVGITENFTAKVEYLFVDFGSTSCGSGVGVTCSASFDASLVRGGLNYKFTF